jgi:Holliday junction DNA helicase RuvA
MIGRLRGIVAHRGSDHVMLDVGGVGYMVYCAEGTLAGLPPVGATGMLWTDMVVREDLLQLFGFPTLPERDWHRLLTSVPGVGAKVSLAILGVLGPDGIGRAIALGDAAAVKAAPGVGPKLAQRVVNELRGKAPAMMAASGALPEAGDPILVEAGAAPAPAGDGGAQAEALSALANLGYGPLEASRAVAEARQDASDTAGLIRAALRRLAPGER